MTDEAVAELVPLSACQPDAIETLLDDAFGNDRHTRTAYLLRAGTSIIKAISFGLIDGEILVGSIQCWPVMITQTGDDDVPLVLVGPVAVASNRQNQGFGQILMDATLNEALLEGNPPLVMIGDPEYYQRFGFQADETGGWQLPGPWQPHRLLLRNNGDYVLPLTGIIGPDIRD